MGMFDTLKFKKPFICEKCNKKISETQTKNFDNVLSDYTEGDFIHGGSVITGVIEETLYCNSCRHDAQKIYISIWHRLYAGSYDNYHNAEKRIHSIEKTDLLDYILFQQKRYVQSARRYNEFHGLIRQFSEYIQDKESFLKEKEFLLTLKSRFKDYIENDNEIETLKKILEDFNGNTKLPDEFIF